MDCNCVSDLLLPPVPALWTPGQSHILLLISLLPHSQLDESRDRLTPFCNVHLIGLGNTGLSSISQIPVIILDYSTEARGH